jgi:hypothetical protein
MPDLIDAAEAEPSAPSSHPLTTKQVIRLFGGDDTVATLLLELDMGATVDKQKVTRLGLLESGVHEHDRWWAEYHPPARGAAARKGAMEGWYMRDESSLCMQPQLKQVELSGIVNLLRFYKGVLQQVRMRLLQINDSYVDGGEVLAASMIINSLDVNDLVDVDYSTSLVDLHEMVHHTEAFLAQHPDYAGIRRSNLLNLYGLADPYREYHRALVATPDL